MAFKLPNFNYQPISVPQSSTVSTSLNAASNAIGKMQDSLLKQKQLRNQEEYRQDALDAQNRQRLANEMYRQQVFNANQEQIAKNNKYRDEVYEANQKRLKEKDTRENREYKNRQFFINNMLKPNESYSSKEIAELGDTALSKIKETNSNYIDSISYTPEELQQLELERTSLNYKMPNNFRQSINNKTKKQYELSNSFNKLGNTKETNLEKANRIMQSLPYPNNVGDKLYSTYSNIRNAYAKGMKDTRDSLSKEEESIQKSLDKLVLASKGRLTSNSKGKDSPVDIKTEELWIKNTDNLGPDTFSILPWTDANTISEAVKLARNNNVFKKAFNSAMYYYFDNNTWAGKGTIESGVSARDIFNKALEYQKNGKTYKIKNNGYINSRIKELKNELKSINSKRTTLSKGRNWGKIINAITPVLYSEGNVLNNELKRNRGSNQKLPIPEADSVNTNINKNSNQYSDMTLDGNRILKEPSEQTIETIQNILNDDVSKVTGISRKGNEYEPQSLSSRDRTQLNQIKESYPIFASDVNSILNYKKGNILKYPNINNRYKEYIAKILEGYRDKYYGDNYKRGFKPKEKDIKTFSKLRNKINYTPSDLVVYQNKFQEKYPKLMDALFREEGNLLYNLTH